MGEQFDDEAAKKRVQEVVWQWTQRLLVLAVVFGFGFFASWLAYGYGPQGAPALRAETTRLNSELVDRRNKQVDIEGKLTVAEGRLAQCNTELSKVRATVAQLQQQLQGQGR